MKQVVGSFGVLLALAALTGCAGSQRPKMQSANEFSTARTDSTQPNDVFAAMNAELSHTIVKDAIDEMDDALSHTIGTTMLTSATLVSNPGLLATPMQLPDSRMSAAEVEPPAAQTWGSSTPPEPSDLPDSRE
jgi:hypothetical protein